MKTKKMLAMLTIAVVLGSLVVYLESIPVQAAIEVGNDGWSVNNIIPEDETDFQVVGNWQISPVGSVYISDPGQGYIDGRPTNPDPGEGIEKCLIVDSSASYVDIYRYIDWNDRLAYPDGTKLALSVLATLYDSTYQGEIQLGVIWYYHSGPDTLVEYDFSDRIDLNTEWSKIPMVAAFSEASESSLYKVKLIIRVHPDGLTKVKIDRFQLLATEGQLDLLDNERRFQSNLYLKEITQNNGRETARLILSCGIDTGDDWYHGWITYKRYIIDYINFTVKTPFDGTKNDDYLDIDPPSMFSVDGSFDDFAALWEHVVTVNEVYERERNILEATATYAMGFFPFGGHISAGLSYARAGEDLTALGEGGIVYPHGSGTDQGRELTCFQEVNALDEMGVLGSLYLRDIIASVPIKYEYNGDPDDDILLEIEVTIGWEQAYYTSDLGESALALSPNPEETTHTYTVNLRDLDDESEWDTDGDGLRNANEVDPDIYGCRTEPTNPDSDYDGLSDGEEILNHLTDPNEPDSDSDGLIDSYEVRTSQTDPNDPDTDSDGLLDDEDPNPLINEDPGILENFDRWSYKTHTSEYTVPAEEYYPTTNALPLGWGYYEKARYGDQYWMDCYEATSYEVEPGNNVLRLLRTGTKSGGDDEMYVYRRLAGLEIGALYELSYDFATQYNPNNDPPGQDHWGDRYWFEVYINDVRVLRINGTNPWQKRVCHFTADSTEVVIRFVYLSKKWDCYADFFDIFVDNVRFNGLADGQVLNADFEDFIDAPSYSLFTCPADNYFPSTTPGMNYGWHWYEYSSYGGRYWMDKYALLKWNRGTGYGARIWNSGYKTGKGDLAGLVQYVKTEIGMIYDLSLGVLTSFIPDPSGTDPREDRHFFEIRINGDVYYQLSGDNAFQTVSISFTADSCITEIGLLYHSDIWDSACDKLNIYFDDVQMTRRIAMTLRPDGDWQTTWTAVGSSDHWRCVDESVTSPNYTDYIIASASGHYERFHFSTTSTPLNWRQCEVRFHMKKTSNNGCIDVQLRTGGVVLGEVRLFPSTSYSTVSYTFTGLDLDQSEVDNLNLLFWSKYINDDASQLIVVAVEVVLMM